MTKLIKIGFIFAMMLSTTIFTSEQAFAEDQITTFQNVLSRKCLDVSNNDEHNGAKIQQWDCNDTGAQSWELVYASSGPSFNGQAGNYYFLRKLGTNKCLDVEGSSKNNGARILLWECHGGDNQKWLLYNHFMVSGYKVSLVAKHSQKCMDVPGRSLSNGKEVVQWDCNLNIFSGTHQHWFWDGE